MCVVIVNHKSQTNKHYVLYSPLCLVLVVISNIHGTFSVNQVNMQYSLHCEQGSFKEMLFYNVMWYMKQNLQLLYHYNTCYYRNKSEVVENIMIHIHT